MGFKENIKNRRLQLNLTLEDVSKKLSLSKPTLQRYESGVITNIPFEKVERLAELLGTTPACLMGWEKIQLSDDERNILNEYRSLDYLGKHTVDTVLEMEVNRCKKQ
jgi:transcriptional regulator with XRE-family HTH domain